MESSDVLYEIYLEVGQKKVFAIATNWPGWCRFDRDEQLAVRKLLNAATRFSKIAKYANLKFVVPATPSLIKTVARLEGNSTTDFGAPDMQLPDDWDPVGADELERYMKLLKACWLAFDEAVEKAKGRELQKGPRGGGRSLTKIIDHVVGAEESYLRRLGWKFNTSRMEELNDRKERVRGEVAQALHLAANGQLPRKGPRGGKRWPPRFFVRRLTWHVVDHAWEIEDRIT